MLRYFTTTGRMVLLTVILVVVALAVGSLTGMIGKVWALAPWSNAAKLERSEQRLEQAQSEGVARNAEAAAQSEIVTSERQARSVVEQARTTTIRVIADAQGASDANIQIDQRRADRLRAADRRLCELVPESCTGAPAASGDTADGGRAVSPANLAERGSSDLG